MLWPSRVSSQSLLRRTAREDRGASIPEFALVLPLLLILVFGIVDFGRALNYWIDTTHLANMGARWAAVDKNPCATSPPATGCTAGMTLQQYIKSRANTGELKNGGTGSVPSSLGVCITPGAGPGEPLTVTVKSKYRWLAILGLPTETAITGEATMRMEQPASKYTAGDGGTGGTCS